MWVEVLITLVVVPLVWYITRKRYIKVALNMEGRYVLITGCDAGFGRAVALQLDRMGALVLATCLTKEGEESLKSLASDKLKAFQMDVTNSNQILDVFREVNKLLGDKGLWGLINNAGILVIGPIEWVPMAEYKRNAEVNLWGLIDVTKTFLPLVKKEKGRIVMVSSIAGVVSPKAFSPYTISKYGVEAFADSLRREMHTFDVQVSIIEPGATLTGIMNGDVLTAFLNKLWGNLPPERQQEYGDEYLGAVVAGFQRWSKSGSPHVYKVVDTIISPLTAPTPKARYLIGTDAWRLKAVSLLPEVLQDLMLKNTLYRVPESVSNANTKFPHANESQS